jgi:thioredoxin reductase (NADPH)
VIHQFDKLQANMEAQEKAFANPKNQLSCLIRNPGDLSATATRCLCKPKTSKPRRLMTLQADGVFIFVGMKPNTDVFNGDLDTDDWGYIKTDEDMMTNIDGVYAVGDIRSKKYRQITTAVADGTIVAAIDVTRQLDL